MMQSIKTYLVCVVAALFLLASCQEDVTEDASTNKGSLEFRFQLPLSDHARQQSDSAAYVLVSVKTTAGKTVLDKHKLQLFQFNDEYISEPVSFEKGNYQLTEYFVLNQHDQIIYATPKADAKLDYLVSNPLPIDFSIIQDQTQKVTPQVISTNGISAVNFGYSTFAFEIVATQNFMISVFAYDSLTENFELTNAKLDIAVGKEYVYQGTVGDSTNLIVIPNKETDFTITVSKQGYGVFEKVLSSKEMSGYSGQPFIVTLFAGINLEDGLIAYYPFSGNAENSIGKDYHGIVEDAILTTDKSGKSNTAYAFDGTSSKITIGDKLDFQSNDFSISFWIKVDDFKGLIPNTGTSGSSVINKGITIYGTPSRSGYGISTKRSTDGKNYFQFFLGNQQDQIFFIEKDGFTENEWYHIVVMKEGVQQEMYINGELAAIMDLPNKFSVDTNIPLVFGAQDKLGNDPEGISFFDGKLDEIRFYGRALNTEEIAYLAQK